MIRNLLDKLVEPTRAVAPITAIVLFLHFAIAPLPLGTLALYLTGTLLLILGIGLFTWGADLAMMPMGEMIGANLTGTRRLWLIILICFLLGLVITIAEPDVQVLAKQVPAVPDRVMVMAVAVGVGLFLVIALLRIIFHVRLAITFAVSYVLIFVLAGFASAGYLAVAFDASGVTTGPVTVPFVLALGAGVAAVRGGSSSQDDSFGLCGLCSAGPILTVLIMGMFYDPSSAAHVYESPAVVHSAGEIVRLFSRGIPFFLREVLVALAPVVTAFAIFQVRMLKLPRGELIKFGVGLLYTCLGLTLLLAGANIGAMPAATYLGRQIASLPNYWILVPLSAPIGFFIVAAEPAVHVLNRQVEEITGGAISKRIMLIGLSVGSALALVLAVLRVITDLNIWYILLPGFGLAVVLAFFVPDIFVGVAFDSGGVAAGTMAGTFLLPFVVGISDAFGGNALTDAFGVIGIIAMMPLVTIQLVGLVYRIKLERAQREWAEELAAEPPDTAIIEV